VPTIDFVVLLREKEGVGVDVAVIPNIGSTVTFVSTKE
jgi:hypothetical protein